MCLLGKPYTGPFLRASIIGLILFDQRMVMDSKKKKNFKLVFEYIATLHCNNPLEFLAYTNHNGNISDVCFVLF